MKSLNLTFKTNKGKKHLLKLSYANSNLDAKTVRQAMDLIASSNLFKKGDELRKVTKTSAPPRWPQSTLIRLIPCYSMMPPSK
ncbi:DUF2922 domain-containing protein [Limosilactobacillus sp.]|uniref:DUF2922 domain-containing protein n=1 Tax=Limosilactobacillus sp. TaxID=2773925 RepID=UPI003EFD929F